MRIAGLAGVLTAVPAIRVSVRSAPVEMRTVEVTERATAVHVETIDFNPQTGGSEAAAIAYARRASSFDSGAARCLGREIGFNRGATRFEPRATRFNVAAIGFVRPATRFGGVAAGFDVAAIGFNAMTTQFNRGEIHKNVRREDKRV